MSSPSIDKIDAVQEQARQYKPKGNSRFGFAFPIYRQLRAQGASHSEAARWLQDKFNISPGDYKAMAACLAGHLTREKRNLKKEQ